MEFNFLKNILRHKQEQRGTNFERKSYYDMKPLKFKTTIKIVPPKLRIEDIDETSFNFDLSSGELIDDNHQVCILEYNITYINIKLIEI